MGYLTAKQFSEIWNISERRIIKLCKEERISGAIKNGMIWMIPEETLKPSDQRSKIAKYIDTEKRIMIVNINHEIAYDLIPLLQKEGFIVQGIYQERETIDKEKVKSISIWETNLTEKKELETILKETERYYDGLIWIEPEKINSSMDDYEEAFMYQFAKKMNCDSSIVLVKYLENVKERLEQTLANQLKEEIGVRINAIHIDVPIKQKEFMYANEIAEDIVTVLTKLKNTTGTAIQTNGSYLGFKKNGRSVPLETGKFYQAIHHYFKNLPANSHLWCASTMLEDEWTEEPLEMNFRVLNLEVANRGVNFERIFIFSKDKIKEFQNNKTLKIYMQSNIKTMFVDLDEIQEKEPKLLEIVGNGWDGINQETLIVDLPAGKKQRGYITINQREVKEAYACFERLKTYTKDLKEVLKK